ncbi:hypothetical protein IWQ60_006657 [Tieghemiomyces parasiticus]|uniref:Staphylococcal nuclease domain-containing protein n=1 Tax=Tieghemiomyces parasiticus TaxID=78921 RepID=A0A9W8AAY2_9FUNG|nr:hypothetical protein IWQ60_006657 [Tieghemiomyces parasiticus]
MSVQKAFVKSVLSGDTVILRGRPRHNGPPPERQLNLSYVAAPRLGSAKKDTQDEPFAFDSRNFLRQLVVGKEVTFRINHTAVASGLEFGSMYIVGQTVDVASQCVREGWCRVREEAKRNHLGDEKDDLLQLELRAQSQHLGMWADPNRAPTARLPRSTTFHGDPHAFLSKYKGRPLDAIVEQVREGSTLRVLVYLPTKEHPKAYQSLVLFLSGIKSPIVRKGIPGMDDLVEPHGEEAKYFVESRLLQRDVQIIVEGLAGTNQNFVGSVRHPAGNIAEVLLAAGLAKCVDWSLPMVTDGSEKLRAAEAHARQSRLRIWKDYVPRETTYDGPSRAFDALVTKVMSADSLQVRSQATDEETKVQLASIRQPRLKDAAESGYHMEAKEYLRKKLIGKQVHVLFDFVRPATDEFEARQCATVLLDGNDLGEQLVAQGLAGVVRHRKDDNDRSSRYDQLLAAENQAIAARRGMHSGKNVPAFRLTDASESFTKARQFLPALQRAGRLSVVVDHVANGGRFKLFVPKDRLKLTFVLAGVRVPRVGKTPLDESEPFGEEGLSLAVERCLQRDVEVEIESVDKTGGFIGTLWPTRQTNFSVELLEAGLATLHEYSASQSPYANQLFAAERAAQQAQCNLWQDYYDEADGTANDEAESIPAPAPLTSQPLSKRTDSAAKPSPDATAAARVEDALMDAVTPSPEYVDVVVSEISDCNRFYLQLVREAIPGLENLMREFSQYHHSGAAAGFPAGHRPKTGDVVSAQFTVDNQWYRARVGQVAGDTAHVWYIDYGNAEELPLHRLRPVPPQFLTLPAQAHEAKLALLNVTPKDSEYGLEAYERLRGMIENRQLVAIIEGRLRRPVGTGPWSPSPSSAGKAPYANGHHHATGATSSPLPISMPILCVTLYDPVVSDSLEASINADLARAGLARVNAKDPIAQRNPHQLHHLARCQEEAKRMHYGMFEYGDVLVEDSD